MSNNPPRDGIVPSLTVSHVELDARTRRTDGRVRQLHSRLDRTTAAVGRLDHRMDIRDQKIDESLRIGRMFMIVLSICITVEAVVAAVMWWVLS